MVDFKGVLLSPALLEMSAESRGKMGETMSVARGSSQAIFLEHLSPYPGHPSLRHVARWALGRDLGVMMLDSSRGFWKFLGHISIQGAKVSGDCPRSRSPGPATPSL